MKSKFVKFGGILIAFLALAALIGSTMTFAQDETPDTPDTSETSDDTAADGTSGMSVDTVDDVSAPEFGRGHGGSRFFTKEAYDAALAGVLGITVDELTAARASARETLLQQAVDEGTLTQEQADAIISGEALRSIMGDIFNTDMMKTAVADALGLTVEELDAAQADGKRLPEIAAEQGVELSAVQEAVQAAHEAAIAQAVADGLITQAQADQLLARGFGGPGGPRGGNGGFGGPRGHGGGMGNGRFGGGNGFQNPPNTLQGDNG